MTVEKIMTTELVTVEPTMALTDLGNWFEQVAYHHFPVVEAGKLVGIISDRDLSRGLACVDEGEAMGGGPVSLLAAQDIMTRDVIVIDRETSIDCASILLLEHTISCLPVVDEDGQLEGLVTWKDILSYHVYRDAH